MNLLIDTPINRPSSGEFRVGDRRSLIDDLNGRVPLTPVIGAAALEIFTSKE